MWSFGQEVAMSALPSLVHTTTSPVAATPKFAPVIPASAVRNSPRRLSLACCVRKAGSWLPFSEEMPLRSKSSPTSSWLKCMAGITMWLGFCSLSWMMRSPRSVSTTSIPLASRKGFIPHSSVSIDLDFTILRTPCSRSIPRTILLNSAASAAQCTIAPFFSALVLNCSRYSSRWVTVCSFISEAFSRRRSHSGRLFAKASRLLRTAQKVSSCHEA